MQKVIVFTMMVITFFTITGCQSTWEHKPKTTCGLNYIKLPHVSDENRIGECGVIAVEQLLYQFKKIKTETIKYNWLERRMFANTLNLSLFAKENGLKCELTKMNATELYKELNEKRPVIIIIPSGATLIARNFSKIFAAHCIVVVGYSDKEIYFYSDGSGPYLIGKKRFLFLWKGMGNVAIRICYEPK